MMEIKARIAQVVDQAVRKAFPGTETGLNYESLLEVPPDSKMGDYAFPCFRLSKSLRLAPPLIAGQLCAAVACPDLCRSEQAGGHFHGYRFSVDNRRSDIRQRFRRFNFAVMF